MINKKNSTPYSQTPSSIPAVVQTNAVHRIEERIAWVLYVLVRWVLGGVFLISGISKLSDPQHFAYIIETYGLINSQWTLSAAVTLSLIEVIAGLGLVLDIRYALTVIAGLLAFFIAILCYGLALGLDVDCGCFGIDDPTGKAFHGLRPALYRDLAMLVCVAFLYFYRHKTDFSPKWIMPFFYRISLRRFR